MHYLVLLFTLMISPLYAVADDKPDCPDGQKFDEDIERCVIDTENDNEDNNSIPADTPSSCTGNTVYSTILNQCVDIDTRLPTSSPATPSSNNTDDDFDWDTEVTPEDRDKYTQYINGDIDADDVMMTSLFNDSDSINHCEENQNCISLPQTSIQLTQDAISKLSEAQFEQYCTSHDQEQRCGKLNSLELVEECLEDPNSAECVQLLTNAKSSGCLIDPFSPACMAYTVSPSCIRNPLGANCFTQADVRDDYDEVLIDCESYNDSLVCVEEEKVDCYESRDDHFCLSTLPKNTAQISGKVGSVISANPLTAKENNDLDSIQDILAMATLEQSETTVNRELGVSVNLKANTVAVFQPPNAQKADQVSLLEGELQSNFDCATSTATAQKVITPIAEIITNDCTTVRKRAQTNTTTSFTSQYQSSAGVSTLSVSVQSGSLTIIDRNNQTTTVSAGNSATIESVVPRVDWVTPINNDYIYANKTNMFVWTAYPNASGYIVEYNLPTPIFTEQNPAQIEYTQQIIQLAASDYQLFNNMVVYNIPLGQTPKGTQFEARIFPIDVNGNILSETVASDKITIWAK